MSDEENQHSKPITYEQLGETLSHVFDDPPEKVERFICDEVEPTTLDGERDSAGGILKIAKRYEEYRENH